MRPLIGYKLQEGFREIVYTLGINNWIVVTFGKSVFVLNAKLYFDNAPAVGESAVEIKQEESKSIVSAIPMGGNIKFSSYMNSWRDVRIMKLPVPPL